MRRPLRLSDSRTIDEPTVNLTPLIDVVFVILIAFIILAPLLELDRIELADAGEIPQTDAVQEASPITIYVKEDNAIIVNGQSMSLSQLTSFFKQAKERYPHARPQLFHDRQAHFGTYQAIKNAAEAAGFQQIDVILKPA